MEKLKRQAGESLVELLLSMLIISLGMLMLAGAITTTARLNDKAQKMSMRTVDSTPEPEKTHVRVILDGNQLDEVVVATVRTGNDKELYFYE